MRRIMLIEGTPRCESSAQTPSLPQQCTCTCSRAQAFMASRTRVHRQLRLSPSQPHEASPQAMGGPRLRRRVGYAPQATGYAGLPGPCAITSGVHCAAYLAKFFSKRAARSYCVCLNSAGSAHALDGSSSASGTPGHVAGCERRKIGSVLHGACASSPEWIASTMARVYLSGQRLPLAPPTHPVLSSHAVAWCCSSLAASIVAYLTGCHTRNGSP
mmetsp:Transcript_57142/g.156923  ORF Transcript_57142/g.156923 Transcript_57142/m.156923 type:complete len:215 (-) Transcript_57142:898-1542(-)